MSKQSKPTNRLPVPAELIEQRIYLIRSQKVMLDFDLAQLYEVETKNLNIVVKRTLPVSQRTLCFSYLRKNGKV